MDVDMELDMDMGLDMGLGIMGLDITGLVTPHSDMGAIIIPSRIEVEDEEVLMRFRHTKYQSIQCIAFQLLQLS